MAPHTDELNALKEQLSEQALALGFVAMGVARAQALGVEAERLRQWLADGYAADMDYMKRTSDVRENPLHQGMLPTAKSIVVLARPYRKNADASFAFGPAKVAQYAQGRDYHNALRAPLRQLASCLEQAGYKTRIALDTMPVFERAWAERAGVGFVGKNCCLIVPGVGSHVFLAALVSEAPLPPDAPCAQGCGECRLCLEHCPTRAFEAPGKLDARRCIAYLTIENRGTIPEPLRKGVGSWLFGCDACQDICPYNRGKHKTVDYSTPQDRQIKNRMREVALEDWLSMDSSQFEALTAGTPFKRPTQIGMARNVLVVLGNRGEQKHIKLLKHILRTHPSEILRNHAKWALKQLVSRFGSKSA
ncbi:MAG: tRNA epoxyqueuosine(34) reductase QueG [Myxococcales bacterium]|nr:MAG: tRNA epoxyqueuosine(34) reductase QueG [Myxococcales bacterium]